MKQRQPVFVAALKYPLGICVLITALLSLGMLEASARGGGGGRMANSSVSGVNHSMSRPAGGGANTGNINRGNVNTGNVNRGNVNTGNINTGNVNRGNFNTGNINRGNVNVGNDVNINIDGGYGYRGGYGYHGGYYHPVAAGVVIGAMAVTTAAVIGSYYRTLPPSCTIVIRNGISYHYCGSVYYQQTWSGNDVVYVVVQP